MTSTELQGRSASAASSSIVTRSAKVLDTVCGSTAPLSQAQIATLTGLPKSSTHRLLSILLGEGLIAFDARRQTYGPGRRLIRWAASAFRTDDLPALAGGDLEALAERTGSHAALAILDGATALYLKTIYSGPQVRLAPRVGERSPAHACAAGKALLARLRRGQRDAVLGELEFERLTERTIVERGTFEADLGQVADRGYATCDREEYLQVVGISAPVFDATGDTVAAVSLWNTVDRETMDSLLRQRDPLLETAAAISRRLGYEAERGRR